MTRGLSFVLGLALVVHAAGLAAGHHELLAAERPASIRLVEVTSESTVASQSVLITATEPVSYTTLQPDPLTVLIMLRNVEAGDVTSWARPAPDDPVNAVEVLDTVDDDGNPMTQVRIRLHEPTLYEVRSRRQTIQVRFARPVGRPPAEAPEDVAPALPLVGRGRPATAITSVGVAVEPHAVSVTLHGNGALSPGRIYEAEHLPSRLVIEFPHLAAEAASLTLVEIDPVKQVRVVSEGSELTQVELSLVRPAVYHIETKGTNDQILRVVFPRDRALDPVARIGAAPSVEAVIDDAPTSARPAIAGEGSPGPIAAAVTGSPLRPAEPADGPRPPVWEGRKIAQLDGTVALADPTALLVPAASDIPARVLPEIPQLTGTVVALSPAAGPLLLPVPGDVPPRVWPEIRQLTGAVAPLAQEGVLLLSPASSDLPMAPVGTETLGPGGTSVTVPSRVADTAPSVTSPAVVADVPTLEARPGTPAVAAVLEPAAVEVPVARVIRLTPGSTGDAEPPTAEVALSRATEQFLPLGVGVQLQQPGDAAQGYTGDPISMDFQGSDLRAVLRVFASDEVSGLNIVIDPSVQGEVNVVLNQVPWDQAFAIILRANGLNYEVDGTVVRIASVQRLQQEAADRALLAQRESEAGELVLYTRTLSYARADNLTQLITNTTLSPRGEVFTDPRTNTIIVRDLQDRLTAVSTLIDTLDRAEPQVEIEARIVQAGHDSARALGVQWGVTGRIAQDIANTLPFSFPNRGGLTGRVGGGAGQGPSGVDPRAVPEENAATVVDLGIAAATSAVGLTLGSVNGALNLDVVLSALESQGELSIISSPRVMTQNNVTAEILQGDQIPYQTVANNTVTVQFKEAALTLRVTPQITAANTVIMEVELENSFADFARALGAPPIPSIVTQRAVTTVQVRDGETTVIGGIFENTRSQRNNQTPMLHRIPLLGWLFKSTDRAESTDELMIFLTPRIVR